MIFMNKITGFFKDLKSRNRLLYINGIISLLLAVVMVILIFNDDRQILGINPWIKPLKFFLSIAILSWSMGWILWYLDARKSVKIYSYLLVITMLVEMLAICLQSYRGTTSHFNVSNGFNGIVFGIMGIAILTFTIATAVICFLYFRQHSFSLTPQMVWSYRLGLLFFLIFSIEGGVMISLMRHTIDLKDGGEGLPLLNWSVYGGDLRVAHFFGMHSLQLIPLVGYFICSGKRQVFLFSGLFFLWVIVLFIQAMKGKPFI
jgi:hypothetical protein